MADRKNLPGNSGDIELLRATFRLAEDGTIISIKTGKPVGYKNNRGYVCVSFKDKKTLAHRVAWALHHGAWPTKMLDHIDQDKTNNRIANLREADERVNYKNSGRWKGGATYVKASGRWQAQIQIDGKNKYLGIFDTKEEAVAVYEKALAELRT